MLTLLQKEFVNCWVLAKDLEAIAARDGSPEVATLCKRIRENYAYPVDSVLLGTDLRVLGHVNAHDVFVDPQAYVAFLRKGLEAAGRTVPAVDPAVPSAAEPKRRTRDLVVTPDRPSASLLDVMRCRGFGQMSFAYHAIDVSAFAEGGVLEIEVRAGSAATGVTFELCAAEKTPAGWSTPGKEAVAVGPVQTKTVASEGTEKLVHTFAKGDVLGLAVKPAPGSTEGDANAFLATVTVRRR